MSKSSKLSVYLFQMMMFFTITMEITIIRTNDTMAYNTILLETKYIQS